MTIPTQAHKLTLNGVILLKGKSLPIQMLYNTSFSIKTINFSNQLLKYSIKKNGLNLNIEKRYKIKFNFSKNFFHYNNINFQQSKENLNNTEANSVPNASNSSNDTKIQFPKKLTQLNQSQEKLREPAPLEYDLRVHAGKIIHGQQRTQKKVSWTSEEESFNEKIRKISMDTLNLKEEKLTLSKQLEVVREKMPYEIKYEAPAYDDMRNSAEIREELEREIAATNIHRYNLGKIDLPDVHKPFSERDIEEYQQIREGTKKTLSEEREDFRQISRAFMLSGIVPFFMSLYFIYKIVKDYFIGSKKETEKKKQIEEIVNSLK